MKLDRRSALRTIGGTSIAPMLMGSTFGAHAAPTLASSGPLGAPAQDGVDDGPNAAEPPGPLPVTGRVLAGLESLDAHIVPLLEGHAMAGATIAIAQGGKLKVARGYGYANVAAREAMMPRTTMVLASVSKVPTAQAILRLVDQGQLALQERVFPHFAELRPPEGRREDPRLNEITVEMCLWHTGGWDRKRTPLANPMQVRRALRLERQPTPDDLIRFQKGVPLDFAPGTEQSYSNFGYVLLGALMARRHREGYPAFVNQTTLHPMGIANMRIDPVDPQYLPGEAHRYTPPADHPIPGGHPLMTMAAGGWLANCIDMARLLTAIDGSRTGTPFLSPPMMQAMVSAAPGIAAKPGEGWFGLGWDRVEPCADGSGGGDIASRFGWSKDGALPGISTWVQHLPIGVNFAILCNSSAEGALAALRPKVLDFVRGIRAWPDGDLFGEFA